MRIGLDATPLLGPRTGVGRYTGELVRELAAGGDDVVATAFTFRGTDRLRDAVPASVEVRARRMPARLLREVWRRTELPPVSWSTGRVDLFHATNFVLPPVGRAAGVVTVHDLSFLRTRDAVDAASRAYRELVPRSIGRAGAGVAAPSSSSPGKIAAISASASGGSACRAIGPRPRSRAASRLPGTARRRWVRDVRP